MDNIKLCIPKKSEYLSCLRLTTSSVAGLNGFNIDEIEDIKVIVSEICVFFINNITKNDKPFEIEYCLEKDKITISITDTNDVCLDNTTENNSEMCLLIIDSLSDDYKIDYNLNKIVFTKKKIH